MSINIYEILDGKWEDGTRPKDIYKNHIFPIPADYVENVIQGLTFGKKRVENGCAELAALLSEDFPELIYPFVDIFIQNTGSKDKMIRWEAVCTLGNLARADTKKVIAKHVDKISGYLRDKSIVLAGHTVRALGKIAAANPDRAKEIFDTMTAASDAFDNNKVGFIIEAAEPLLALPGMAGHVKAYASGYIDSDIAVVVKKAKKMLKKIEKLEQ